MATCLSLNKAFFKPLFLLWEGSFGFGGPVGEGPMRIQFFHWIWGKIWKQQLLGHKQDGDFGWGERFLNTPKMTEKVDIPSTRLTWNWKNTWSLKGRWTLLLQRGDFEVPAGVLVVTNDWWRLDDWFWNNSLLNEQLIARWFKVTFCIPYLEVT